MSFINQIKMDLARGDACVFLGQNKMCGKALRVDFSSRQQLVSDEGNNVWVWFNYDVENILIGFHVTHRCTGNVFPRDGNWKLPENFDELKTDNLHVAISHAYTLVCEYKRCLAV